DHVSHRQEEGHCDFVCHGCDRQDDSRCIFERRCTYRIYRCCVRLRLGVVDLLAPTNLWIGVDGDADQCAGCVSSQNEVYRFYIHRPKHHPYYLLGFVPSSHTGYKGQYKRQLVALAWWSLLMPMRPRSAYGRDNIQYCKEPLQ